MENDGTREIERLTRENKIFKVKTANSLANNLCPDHRDKQAGKLCLACEIDRLQAENKTFLEALKHIWDYSAKQFKANSDERALWAQVNGIASAAIAKAERKEP